MLFSIFSFLLLISNCFAYDNQWVPSFYINTYPERFQTLRMIRGSCIVSLKTYRSNHFNVEIPLSNGTTPAGFCAILLNSSDNLNLAIAIEQGLSNNNLANQNVKLFQVKNGNVKLMKKACGLNNVSGLTLAESSTAVLIVKADQSINFSLSVYTYQT